MQSDNALCELIDNKHDNRRWYCIVHQLIEAQKSDRTKNDSRKNVTTMKVVEIEISQDKSS